MHKTHSLTIHTDGMGAAVHIPDIISHDLTNNAQFETGIPNHEKYPTHLSLLVHDSSKQLVSFAVEALLDAIGVGGLCIKSTTNPGVTLNLAAFDECGDILAGSVHRGLTYLAGVIFPQQLTVEHRGDARLTVGVAIVQKGVNDPIVVSDTITLPTIALASARWTLGKISVAGTALSNFTSFMVDFGFQVEKRGVESALYDKQIEVKQVSPSWMITGIDPTWFSTTNVPLAGKLCTHANTIMYLRKRDADGNGFIADVATEHLKFTMNGVATVERASSSQESRYSETALKVTGRKDAAGNAPLSYTGAIAIP